MVVVDAARAGGCRPARQRRPPRPASRGTTSSRSGPRPDVDAEHRVVVAPARDQPGVGATGAVGGDDQGRARELLAQLEGGADVAELSDRRRATERHGVRASPGVAEPVGLARRWPPRGRSSRADPAHTMSGREELVEHHVAGGLVGRLGAEDDRAGEAEVVGGRRGHAHVVGLPTAAGHERVAALVEGVGAQVLELAHLVPTTAEAREVVPLHPEPARGSPSSAPSRSIGCTGVGDTGDSATNRSSTALH